MFIIANLKLNFDANLEKIWMQIRGYFIPFFIIAYVSSNFLENTLNTIPIIINDDYSLVPPV